MVNMIINHNWKFVAEPNPKEQGLKHVGSLQSFPHKSSCRTKSKRTRIET